MRAVVWILEESWETCIEQARQLLPPEAEVTLLHVAPGDVEELAAGGHAALLGRHPARPEPMLRAISDEEARGLLAAAERRLARPARAVARHGRVEREVVDECAGAQLLVLARDGAHRLGPKSLGPRARFVVDHAPCAVVLVWPKPPPGPETMPPPPHRHHDRHGL
jgi:nucleotide-binding universal stress UspA family protein